MLFNPGPSYTNLSKKQLHSGHVNFNGLRNKTNKIGDALVNTGIHFLGVAGTKLDGLVLNRSLATDGYEFLKRNRNGHGGGVGLYYKDCFVCRVREDLCTLDTEVLWAKFHRPQAPIILVGIFYCLPNINTYYMKNV